LAGTPVDPALNLVGLGLRLGHMTREVEAVLDRCRHVYYLHDEPETVRFLTNRRPSPTSLSSFYATGTSRLETYYRISARVISHAAQDPPVGVALYGHPTIFSTLTSMLLAGARRFAVSAAVYPGISSIDAIVAELGLDPGRVALQVHEATELLVYDRSLDPSSALLIFQASQLETRIHSTMPNSPTRLEQLVDRLSATHGPSHVVTVLEVQGTRTGRHWSGPLNGLAAAAPTFGAMVTLYVPPRARPLVRDATMLEQLDDPTKLSDLVQ
jgi:tetrapyrrole methylase family protein/MazG family protein